MIEEQKKALQEKDELIELLKKQIEALEAGSKKSN